MAGRLPCSPMNPHDEAKAFDAIARRRVEQALQKDPFNIRSPKSNPFAYAIERAKRAFNTQRKSTSQLTEGSLGGFLGNYVSWEDLFALIKSPADRKAFEARIIELTQLADNSKAAIIRDTHVNLHDAKTALRQYAASNKVSYGEAEAIAYKHMMDPASRQAITDPHMAEAVAKFDENHKTITKIILEDESLKPELREMIIKNQDRHMMRQYSIHKINDLVFQPLREDHAAYQQLFDHMRNGDDTAMWRDEIIDEWRPELEKAYPEASDEAITEMLSTIVDNRVNGEISAIVKNSLRQPSAQGVRGAIVKAKGEYLIERVVEDPRIRKLLGEEEHASLAAANLAGKVAHDVKARVLRKGLYDELHAAGMLSDEALPGLDVKLNRTTLKPFVDGVDDARDGVLYTNGAVRDVLNAVYATQSLQGISKLVGYVKLGKILTMKGVVNNTIGAIQSAIMGGGIGRSLAHPVRTLKDAVLSAQLSREIAFPGTAGLKGEVSDFMKSMGFRSVDEIRDAAKDLIQRGLDVGGEYFAEGTEALRSGMRGDVGKGAGFAGKSVAKFKKGANVALEFYRAPDIATKVFVYRKMVEEMAYKLGVETLTEAQLNAAARDTLKLTQDPRTTADFVRNLSRGPMGVFTGNFQGFFYQMTRNVANSVHLGVKDAATAMKLMKNGDVAAARRYAAVASDRLISTAVISYGLYSAVETTYNAARGYSKDKIASLKEFMPAEDRNSTLWVEGQEKGKDGQIYVKVIKPGSIDVYDASLQVLRAFIKNGTKDPMKAVMEAKDALVHQMIGPGLILEAVAAAFDKRVDVNENFLESSAIPWEMRPTGNASIPRAIAPTMVNDVASGISTVYEMARPESDSAYEKAKSRMFSLGSKMGVAAPVVNAVAGTEFGATPGNMMMATAYRMNLSQAVRNRFTEEYRRETWIPEARKAYKNAKTLAERTRIIKENEARWSGMIDRMVDVNHHAQGIGLSTADVYRIIKDKDGYIGMPKEVARSIALGRKVSLREYLYGTQ